MYVLVMDFSTLVFNRRGIGQEFSSVHLAGKAWQFSFAGHRDFIKIFIIP